MEKIKQLYSKGISTLNSYRNDGTDPRKNDLWRVLLFASNSGASYSLGVLIGKWSYFTQNVLELGILIALVSMAMRVLDAITDPIIASAFDNFKPKGKVGKCRIFMITGGLFTILPTTFVFFYPIDWVNAHEIPFWVTVMLLAGAYSLYTIGATVLSIATGAGQVIITQDQGQRPLYALGATIVDSILAVFVSVVITGGLIGDMADQYVWKIASGILAVVSIVLLFLAAKAIENRDNEAYYELSNNKSKTNILEFWYFFKRSKPMRRFLVANISDSIAASVRASFAIYLFANIFMRYQLNSIFEIVNSVLFGFPVLVIGMYLASKRGATIVYKRIAITQTVISLAGFFYTLFFMKPDASTVYEGLTFNIVMTMLLFGIYISSLGVSSNLVGAMTADITDYEYSQTGQYIPGVIAATRGFVTKIIKTGVSLITTGMMWFCFKDTEYVVENNTYQNDKFFYCILLAIFIFPAAGHILTNIAMIGYPLTEEKMQEVSQIVAGAREQASQEKQELLERVIKNAQAAKEESEEVE
ncbi:MAG: MFS transporter [Clostridia bacterium]